MHAAQEESGMIFLITLKGFSHRRVFCLHFVAALKHKMPSSCCVVNCSNRKKKNSTLKFYSIPINPEQRKRWLNAIRRENWSEVEINNARVCSEHFLSGLFYFIHIFMCFVHLYL